MRTKLMLTNSFIISVIKYAAPILINSNHNLLSKLQVLIMKSVRPILGFKSFKYSTSRIMNELKWCTIYQLIMKECITLIHKSIHKNQPKSIFNFFTYSIHKNENICTVRKPILCNIPKSNSINKTIFVNGLYLYNTLPDDILSKNP